MLNTFVSIIVPNLHSPVVGNTLKALRDQDYPGRYEVIVVGQDKYGQVHEDELTHVIKTPQPVSPAKARNLGIQAAHGEILAFTDADCIPARDWLSRIVTHFSNNPEIQVLGGGVDFSDDNYWTFCDNLASFYPYMTVAPPGTRDQLPSLNLSTRRSVFDAVGFFDERYPSPAGEDADLTTRMRLQGFTLYFDPEVVVYHQSLRGSLAAILRHSFRFGRYSIKVDPRYQEVLQIPWPMRHWLALFLFSPLLAAGVLRRLLSFTGRNTRILRALPVVYIAKLAWCAGAVTTLKHGSPLFYTND